MRGLTKKMLLLLASGVDEIIDWDKTLSSHRLNLGFPSYKNEYFQQTVKKMLKTGDIEKIIRHGEPVFRITSQGETKLVYSVPLAKRIGKKWDKKWRMIIFDIPEIAKKQRDTLRYKLKDLGFAKWQESVYITPFDVAGELAEYLQVSNLADFAVALEAKKIFIGDEKEMANKLWHLSDLNSRYQEFFNKIRESKDKKGLQEEYLTILQTDPYLPEELLPKPWWGNMARKLL